ncbi:MAG: hypothetical protein WA771_12995 [Chthoniobacterales bacterium]
MVRRGLILALVFACSGEGVFGQNATSAEERVAQTPRARGAAVGGTIGDVERLAPASAGDPDIGEQVLLQPAATYEAFSAWSNWNYLWTSNPDLLDDTSESDGLLTGSLGGSFLPYLGKNLFGEFSAEQSIYRYADRTDLDFDALSLTAGLIYVVRDLGDLTLFTNYNYDLLTDRAWNGEIFHSHTITAGARKVFAITRGQRAYTSFSADFNVGGWPDYALRHNFSWLTGYQANLTRSLTLDLYYQISAQAYLYDDRADLNQLIGGGLTYGITEWLSVQTTASLGINSSTEEFYDYFAANLGGGIGVLINF